MERETIYFDNSAVTRMDERVLDSMKPYLFEIYAVASSDFGYSMGIKAKKSLNIAREKLSRIISAQNEEFIFTSGATESSNTAIKGAVKKSMEEGKNHIITTAIEDFPVLNTVKSLEKDGIRVSYLEVDEKGFVNLQQMEDEINDRTILASIQHANQEIGTVQDIEKIGSICHSRGILFHTDATHTFTRLPIDVNEYNIDLLTVSAHTIHGPKGMGGLYIKKDTPFSKWMDGGFQEFNRRAGVENIPGAVGFARAAELVTEDENKKLIRMRDHMIDKIISEIPHTTLNGSRTRRLPQNVNITFHQVEGESITLHMDMRGYAISTGSACFSSSLEASHVIIGIGGNHERAHGSVRFSLSRYNKMEDTDTVVEEIGDVVGKLREISPLSENNKEV
jgi:cysteine desulfurase